MPNWCSGTLKVRGEIKCLENFIVKGLEPVTFLGEDKPPLTLEDDEGCLYCKSDDFVHIKGTRRGFVRDLYIEIFYEDKTEIQTLTLETEFAWGIHTEQLLDLAKEFNVDIKIYAFERGMEFNQNIEIVNGEIIKDEEIKFDDYLWECICPNMGG